MKCHICNADIQGNAVKRPWNPNFRCPYCYTKADQLAYCQACWWWECGPMPALAGLPAKVKKPSQVQDEEPTLVSPCPLRPRDPQQQQQQTEQQQRADHLMHFKAHCGLVSHHWTKGINASLGDALSTYDALYYVGDEQDPQKLEEQQEQRRLVHALCAAYWTSHYLCRDITQHKVHLWDTPVVAAKHLEVCYFGMSIQGKAFVKQAMRVKARAALLAQETVERVLKDKLGTARAHQQLRDIQGALGLGNDAIKEVLELAIMTFHCCTALRKPDDHNDWIAAQLKPDDPRVDQGTFKPGKASGFCDAAFHGAVFAGNKLTDAAQQKLGAVYASLCTQGAPPQDRRFPDQAVAALTGGNPAVLTAAQARYLQSVPRYDHTDLAVAQHASPCELAVRTRVKTAVRGALAGLCAERTRVTTAQDNALTQHVADLVTGGVVTQQEVPDPLTHAFLVHAGREIARLKTQKEADRDRYNKASRAFSKRKRQFRADAITALRALQRLEIAHRNLVQRLGQDFYFELRDLPTSADFVAARPAIVELAKDNPDDPTVAAAMDTLLDALVQDIRDGGHWIEHTSKDGLFSALAHNKDLFLKTETYDAQQAIDWADVLALCPEGNPGGTGGSFTGMDYDVTRVQGRTDGRENAWPWYMDWRVEKDRFLYDYNDLPPRELSNFASFTLWRYDECPSPYQTYGHHMIVLDPHVINLDRAVITMGDKGHPRRSALLLLQDLLCKAKDKYGNDPPAAPVRMETLLRLIVHAGHRPQPVPDTAGLRRHYKNLVTYHAWKDFRPDRFPAAMTQMLPVLEMHVFGPLRPADALALYVARQYWDIGESRVGEAPNVVQGLRTLKQTESPAWELVVYRCIKPSSPAQRPPLNTAGAWCRPIDQDPTA